MTKIIILDDEKHCTDILSDLISRIPADYHVDGVFNDPFEAMKYIRQNEIDILFLDIEMPGMNGFTFLDKILPINFDIIFTTAYDQYAIRAFQYSAINYLLKPISEKAIVQSLAAWQQRKNKTKIEQWNMLRSFIKDTEKEQSKIALPTGIGHEIIEIKDIVRCQAESNYSNFFFADNSKMLVCRTLKDVEEILSEKDFFRVHQSHLINPKYVKTISKQDGGTLIMTDGSKVPVSRQKRSYMKSILDSMLNFNK